MRHPHASLSGAERAARIKLAKRLVTEGGTMKQFCEGMGLRFDAGTTWLKNAAPDLRAELQKNRRHGPLPQPKVVRGLIRM